MKENPSLKSGSRLERTLAAGHFAVTAELGPPKGTDIEVIRKKAAFLKDRVDGVNLTDNQTAVVRMSSIGAGVLCVQMGLEPVVQMVCRDRNRIAMQSDILGATALGIRNLLCLSGDHQCFGNHGCAKNVYDIDSIQQLSMMKRLRDDKKFCNSNDPVEGEVPLFLGAAENPFAHPQAFRALRLKKKVEAGADFIQTQVIYDMDIFREWMKQVRNLGLHEQCHILAGVIPLKSAGMARYMAEKVSGVILPDTYIQRMAGAAKGQAAEEGIKICLEQIDALRTIEGVHGIHLMAIEWEHKVPHILERAGLAVRPSV